MTPHDGEVISVIKTEFTVLKRISDYIAERKQQLALEAEIENMDVKASEVSQSMGPGKDFDPIPPDKVQNEEQDKRLDAIYGDEPFGFEKDPLATNIKMLAQDPLEEVDLGEGVIKSPAYISANIHPQLKIEVVQLLREFKECVSWDYDEMSGLSRELVKLKLLIKPGKKPVKQNPKIFASAILSKIKEEVERLLRCNFIPRPGMSNG